MPVQETVDKLKARIIELVQTGKDMFATMDEFSEWNSLAEIMTNVSTLSNFVMTLVGAAEIAANDLSSEIEEIQDEEKLAAAAAALDDMIELPWWLEKIDGPVFEMLLALGDNFLDKQYPEGWDLDVVRDAVQDGKDLIVELRG